MPGDTAEPVPEPNAGASNVAVVGSNGEDPMPVTVGTCAAERVVDWGLNSAERVGGFNFQPVEV